MNDLTNILKSKKLKVTPQRLAIYGTLHNTNKHPNAESIYNILQPTYPTMSLATVYKTLDTLKKSNLVLELNVGEDSFRYDANTSDHAHLVCQSCHEVFDFHSQLLNNLIPMIQEETDFDILSKNTFFYGICTECQSKTQ